MEIKRKNNNLVLFDNNVEIESYCKSSEINFKGLSEYLLALNLSKKIGKVNEIENMEENEKTLLSLINQIIDIYNKKVDELTVFNDNLKNSNKL